MTQQSPWWCFYFPRPLIQAQLSSINIFSLHNMFRHSGPDHVRHTTGKFLWCFSSTSQKVKVKRSELSSKLRLQRTVKILSNSFKKWSPPGQYLSFSTVDHIFTRQTTGSADHLDQSTSRHQHTDDIYDDLSWQRYWLHPSSHSLTQRRTSVMPTCVWFCSDERRSPPSLKDSKMLVPITFRSLH